MSKLLINDYSPTAAAALRVASLQLTPYENLAAVKVAIDTALGDLRGASDALQLAHDAVIAQNAVIRFEDRKLDRIVIEAARDKRAMLSGPQPDQQPAFRDVFPSSPAAAMKGGPDDDQDHYVAAVQAGLELPENAALKAKYGAALAEQQARVEAAVAKRDKLDTARSLKESALERATVAARRAFNEAQLDVASLTKDEALTEMLFDFRSDPPPKKKAAAA